MGHGTVRPVSPSQQPAEAVVHDGVEGWTVDGSSDDPVLLRDATALLDTELPDPRFVDTAYLRWIYRDLASPHGGVPELFSPQPAEVAAPSDE